MNRRPGMPFFDPWRATKQLRAARDQAQDLADLLPAPSREIVEFIAYCDERIGRWTDHRRARLALRIAPWLEREDY
jgi:hypothetical protein